MVTRPWLKMALFASVAVNLLVAGLGVGHYVARPGGPPTGMASGVPGRALEGMAPEQRRVVDDAFAKRRGEMQAARRAFGESRTRAAEILSRPTFDEAALSGALAEVRRNAEAVQRLMHETTIEAARSLPQDARQKLAEAGRRPRPPARREAAP